MLYFRDVRKNLILPNIIQIKGNRLVYEVQKKVNSNDQNLDLVVCNYNLRTNGTC